MSSAAFTTAADISDDDWRKTSPRFVGENFRRNLRIVDEAAEVAWFLAQGGERHDEGNMAAIDR
jgi:hypothetical protein